MQSRASGDLLLEKVQRLFAVRRQLQRLQIEEERLVKSIGRDRRYEGFRKCYPYRDDRKKLLLKIMPVKPRVIDPMDLLRVLSRRKDFSMKKDFYDLLCVSYWKVVKRFGRKFAERLAYDSGLRSTRVEVELINNEDE